VDKNPGSTNKYTKFGQLIIRKLVKITATRCYILRLKWTKFDSCCPSVFLFVRLSFLCLRWSLALSVSCYAYVETSLGAVVPQETEIRRVDACTNEHVQVFMHDVFHLQRIGNSRWNI